MASEDSVGAKRVLESDKPSGVNPANFAQSPNDPSASAANTGLSEDAALALLRRPDLPADVLERLGKNSNVLKHRKVKLALVEHPKTPRHVSLPLVRQLYTFDLMQVALTPVVPADVKLAAEEALCNRMETISSGEKLTLAHRASGRVARELLLDRDSRVMQTALQNARLTEALIVRALMRPEATVAFVEAVSHHGKWSLRREVRVALLRNEKTPMARAVEFARGMPAVQVKEILQGSRLPGNVKSCLLADVEKRATGKRPG
jgi:hypothetical protein